MFGSNRKNGILGEEAMRSSERAATALFLYAGVACASLLGCSRPSPPTENPSAANLRTISQAYDLVLFKKGRPPQNVDDLKPFLKELRANEDPDVLLRSPNDNEPYEIVWGVNLDNASNISAVLAHEKNGVNGTRYVITVARLVKTMGDEDFQHATLATGKKPGKRK